MIIDYTDSFIRLYRFKHVQIRFISSFIQFIYSFLTVDFH